ncbi:MAG TPA: toll/interleukin-1 receptor domain-containing protein [Pyrinomonadaceae bacterium]|nr:toll/interleukin-1 receptor domain-containing protein [Pyrinomonadaceae bacterium]
MQTPENADAPAADDGASFRYDVFISYRHREPDKSWVRKTLVPVLRAGGLSVCLDADSFVLGSFVVEEMEHAVEQSRHTLVVLSPNYLASGFTEFERRMAQFVESEKGRERCVFVLLAPCETDLKAGARLWLEMTDEESYRVNLPRLMDELRQRP